MITEGNKTKVEKAGLDDEIRDGYEYEMTVALEIVNDKHLARASKDRTGLFVDKPEFIITIETGKLIQDWCNQGVPEVDGIADFVQRINTCKSIAELGRLYAQYPQYQRSYNELFTRRKRELLPNTANSSPQTPSLNGNSSIQQSGNN